MRGFLREGAVGGSCRYIYIRLIVGDVLGPDFFSLTVWKYLRNQIFLGITILSG